MKTLKILFILIIIFGITYYQLDKRLFYFGRNGFHIYHLLPFNIEPDYSPPFEGGFALRNKDGLSIAGRGVAYPVNGRTIWINKVLKYGFNEQHLVAIALDSNETKYYLNFYLQPKDSSVIGATMDVENKINNLNLDKWIDIDGNDDFIWNLVLCRNYSMFIIIILLLVLVYKLVKYRKYQKQL